LAQTETVQAITLAQSAALKLYEKGSRSLALMGQILYQNVDQKNEEHLVGDPFGSLALV